MAGETVSSAEFKLLREHLDSRFDAVHEQVTALDNKFGPMVIEHEKQIAVLEFQAGQAEKAARSATQHVQSSKKMTTSRASLYGAGAGSVAVFILEAAKIVKAFMTGH